MSPLLCLALLALCGIGVVVHASSLQCALRKNYLIRQQVQIQKLEIKQQMKVKLLNQFCMLDLPPIPDAPTANQKQPLPTQQAPTSSGGHPSNLSIVVIYPPGSPCNPKPNDSLYSTPPPGQTSPTEPPGPTLRPGETEYPTYPPGASAQGWPAYPTYSTIRPVPTKEGEYPTYPPGDTEYPTYPPGASAQEWPTYPTYSTIRPVPTEEGEYPTYPPNESEYPTYPPGDSIQGWPAYPTYSTIRPVPTKEGEYPTYPPNESEYPTYPPGDSIQGWPAYPTYSTIRPVPTKEGEYPTYPPNESEYPTYPPGGSVQGLPAYPTYPTIRPVPTYMPGHTEEPTSSPDYPSNLVKTYPPNAFPKYSTRQPSTTNLPDKTQCPTSPTSQPTTEWPILPPPGPPGPTNNPFAIGPPNGAIFVIVDCPYSYSTRKQQLTDSLFQLSQQRLLLDRQPSRQVSFRTAKDVQDDSKLKTVELIKKYGYPVETHFVKTTDGYVLCLHRIPRPGAPVVLLVHGLMSSSAAWVQMGPSNGLAYLLYRQGYDVWLLNTRGNIYSQKHVNPDIKPAEYWSFTFHQIGIYDLPDSIDKILDVTKQTQIQYIGHSQGSTAFFVMCSELPDYCEKVILMQALSPTVFMEHTQSPVLRFFALFKSKFRILLNLLGGYEISKNNRIIAQFRNHICKGSLQESPICAVFEYVMCGFGWNQFNSTLTPLVVGHASQGASSYQVYHYAQLISSVKFQAFDHGEVINEQQYQKPEPPAYNLTQVNCKVAIHHATDDWLSSKNDVQSLSSRLPNVIDEWNIQEKGFSHYDYMLSQQVNQLINNRVINNCVAQTNPQPNC
ncbi:uncharacterized protein LOC135437401 [Drosophila montana]|uniref:uncharacterized protein LOC135437401 n=1 Tax=Drosophila montana TaxID=40370 RepID=UPI00313E6C4E